MFFSLLTPRPPTGPRDPPIKTGLLLCLYPSARRLRFDRVRSGSAAYLLGFLLTFAALSSVHVVREGLKSETVSSFRLLVQVCISLGVSALVVGGRVFSPPGYDTKGRVKKSLEGHGSYSSFSVCVGMDVVKPRLRPSDWPPRHGGYRCFGPPAGRGRHCGK